MKNIDDGECPECGYKNMPGRIFCSSCGSDIIQ